MVFKLESVFAWGGPVYFFTSSYCFLEFSLFGSTLQSQTCLRMVYKGVINTLLSLNKLPDDIESSPRLLCSKLYEYGKQ